jgi:exonuclease SbcC
MTLLDSFTKPGWQHRKPEVRIAAIDQLEDETILLGLVNDDPEPAVRKHALSRISGSEALDQLIESLDQPLQGQAKAQRLAQLLPDPQSLSSITDDATLVRIASLSEEPGLITDAIGRVSSVDVRMDLAAHHAVARVRLNAAQGIEDLSLLKELILQSRNKDKSVYRHCKERLDQQHQAEKEQAELQKTLRKLAEDVRKLSAGVDFPDYKSRYLSLKGRWETLIQHCVDEQRKQILDDLEICASRIEKHAAVEATEQARREQTEEAKHTFGELINELEAIDLASLELAQPDKVRELASSLDAIEDRWLAALHDAHPSAEQTEQCKQQLNHWRAIARASKRILNKQETLEKLQSDVAGSEKADFMAHHKLLEKVEKHIQKLPWPEAENAATPGPVLKLHALRDELQQKLIELKKDEKKALEVLKSTFSELQKELDDSHFKNADRVHNRIKNLLRHLGPSHQQHFYDELRPLTARLREIHDWQGFAIEPKKAELIERMKALVGSEESADSLASRIKALQEEWKTLGPVSPRRDQALWNEFHSAAEEAYKPCKEAFAQQSAMRKVNLRRRMELVGQLADYDQRMTWPESADASPDAPVPDWKMVQKTLDTARAAFNDIKPVSGKGERKSRQALQKICDKIYSHIKDEYERNIARKEKAVARAQEYVELEDLREAINQTKDIQREWKSIGLTPRQVDRRLWKKFRSACDAVFARLDDERKQQNAARNERMEEAKARAEQARARANLEQQRWPSLLERLRACASRAEDSEKAEQLWQQEAGIPRGIDKNALEAYWDQGVNAEIAEDELRQACVAMEVFIGVESPPEDKQARMDYQMKRLLEGMGSQQGDHEQLLLEQLNAFIAMRPPHSWLERFYCGGKIIP